MADTAPFILTLTLDPVAQAYFDRLRAEHFPPSRLFVGAHVTLFHALPSDLKMDALANVAAERRPFPIEVTGLRLLGRGVAFALEAAPLRAARAQLRAGWTERLTPQDRQPWQPHVTIQNKVEPMVAQALHRALSETFVPWLVTATGLALWRYRNGPWERAAAFPFREQLD